MSRIYEIADAIRSHEGYFKPFERPWLPFGSKSYRNNNPGNIKLNSYSQKFKGRLGEQFGFIWFDSYQHGWEALIEYLTDAASGKRLSVYNPEMTMLQFFTIYSFIGWEDEKNRVRKLNYNYATDVAKKVGLSINTKIKEWLVDLDSCQKITCPYCNKEFCL